VVFDRRLRTPPTARLLSTLDAGPVIILTTPDAARSTRADVLRTAGATVLPVSRPGLAGALSLLPALDVQSLVIEGGARVHAAAWEERIVDYVHLYVAPVWLGGRGVPMLGSQSFSPACLVESRVDQLGPDVLIEGYVHRPH
jgi:diaminohydroxyphosphoribosylaminopyrimidine deaminase/5-amino-6-(5-phosphoribosylamino)uracil reductase